MMNVCGYRGRFSLLLHRLSVRHRRGIVQRSRDGYVGSEVVFRDGGHPLARSDLSSPALQVFGANTEIGKTVISTGVVRAALRHGLFVQYLKPLQTGVESAPADAEEVQKYCLSLLPESEREAVEENRQGERERDGGEKSSHVALPQEDRPPLLKAHSLFTWNRPCSPHLASQLDGDAVSDAELLTKVAAALNERSNSVSQFLKQNAEVSSGAALSDLVAPEERGGSSGGGSLPQPLSAQSSSSTSSSSSSSSSSSPSFLSLSVVETAGGVCSPSSTLSLQVDAFRPLRLPVLLVGDGRLGGISSTVSALDSLAIRGYDVLAVAMIEQDSSLGNKEAIASHLEQRDIPLFTFPALPEKDVPLHRWFEETELRFDALFCSMMEKEEARLKRLQKLSTRAAEVVWWPFTQHQGHGKATTIDSAFGDYFTVLGEDNNSLHPLFDACASWWTQGVGHGNAEMARAIAEAAGRYGHVMFPSNANELAVRVSELVLETIGGDWAKRVFFSDDGSTAVEVAIKMGMRKFLKDHSLPSKTSLSVLCLENCYHGDTLGTMDVAEPSVFNERQHPWYEPRGVTVSPPFFSCFDGKYRIVVPGHIRAGAKGELTDEELTLTDRDSAFDATRDKSHLAQVYRKYVDEVLEKYSKGRERIGTLLIEPVLQGAGGMILVDPLFQRVMIQQCRQNCIPVVFDEVFCGLWRLGVPSARELLGEDPDVACYAKLLTGGVVPMALTVASDAVFKSFLGDSKAEALLHGHSYTANPIGCAATAVALQSIYPNAPAFDKTTNSMTEFWNASDVRDLSLLPSVKRTFSLGTVVAVELQPLDGESGGYSSSVAVGLVQELLRKGVFARCLGNVIYAMCAPTSDPKDLEWVLKSFREVITKD